MNSGARRPVVGRGLSPRSDASPTPREVVLSDGLWRRRFAGDRGVVGREVSLAVERYTVVGVVPRGLEYPVDADVWAPLEIDRSLLSPPARTARFLRVVTRLRSGVSVAQPQAELSTIAGRLAGQFPTKNEGVGALVIPLREYMIGDVRTPLLVLMGAVGLVMLIACANVANLLLVRAAGRVDPLVAIRAE
jgi:putative ABC transport system permease protein